MTKTELAPLAWASIVFNLGSVFEPSGWPALVWLLLGVTLLVVFFKAEIRT